MEFLGAAVGGFGRIVGFITRERHRFTIAVDRDTMESGGAQTVALITNAGNRFERNVKVRVQAAVPLDDNVRFITVQSEDDDLVEIEQEMHQTTSKRFTTHHLSLKVDGLQKGARILIRMLSNNYLDNLQVRVMSDKATSTYDSRKHDPSWTPLSAFLRSGEPDGSHDDTAQD